jgi:hypothetical protein
VRLLYKQMLPRFGSAEFWSTSIPTKDYFWGDPAILAAIKDFISNRDGRMKRIFFLNTAEPDQEALEIMREQAAVGVEVYYIPTSELTKELTQLYFIGANRNIAWRVTIDNLTKVNEVKTTIRKEDVEAYRRNFKRILDLKSTRKFELAEN